MLINLLWTGREYYSLEHCQLASTGTGSRITSVIIGTYAQRIYRVEYVIETNPDWVTLRCDITAQLDHSRKVLRFRSDGHGNWWLNDKPAEQFRGCTDVDIPLTPFTNTLPINRLKLAEQESQQIQVLYVDLLADDIKSVRQNYTRLSNTGYKYENVPNDFEAVITVDPLGLVVDYPELFFRTASQNNSDY
ncbi:putative glycolipid-binding domain-containing protein [Spirosoma sp.]|uniref:putative glycolipid-binding domain-containing protein n=1 Tax=Spirosoma sp. TaxID=1899569 RepID=UPI003B3BB16C